MTTAAPQQSRLSPEASARLGAALQTVAALSALSELAAMLEGGRWAIAGQVADRLSRFESTAWTRIRTGARGPRDRIESLLADLAASGLPRSQRKLFDLLA